MALIKCRECAKDISSQAKTCPHCGVKKPGPPSQFGRKLLAAGATLFVGSAILQGIKPPAPPPSAEEQAATSAATEKYAEKELGEQSVRALLKDPSSAIFYESEGRTVNKAHVACGYVNAKNSFGAMTGKTPWLVMIDLKMAMIESPSNKKDFVKLWNKYCTS